MKKKGLWLALAGALFTTSAFADGFAATDTNGGDWMVRLRATRIITSESNTTSPAGAAGVGAALKTGPVGNAFDGLGVSNKTIPELDISYFFTKNVSAELILTYPQKHDVTINNSAVASLGYPGTTKIGTVKELPPTLLLQYHFLPGAIINPYVGAGFNWTFFSKTNLHIDSGALAGTNFDLSQRSFGGALQVGADIPLVKNLSLNLDVKKVFMSADVNMGANQLGIAPGTNLTTLHIDPWLYSVGLGWKF